jgi:hypothetical protein
VKKITASLVLFLFTAATLVMPYANYDDVRSICAVYNHCLAKDADMDFLEFVGEKLLASGLPRAAEEEEEETAPPTRSHPVNPNAIVQIQAGVLYVSPAPEMIRNTTFVVRDAIPLVNTILPAREFYPGIFHPPSGSRLS